MTQADYDKVSSELMALAASIEDSKRPGYTVGSSDVLANFKRVAERAGVTTEQAWAIYFLKHVDAVLSILTKPELPVSEEPPGRFADLVNYTRLGYAIWRERSGEAALSSPLPPPTSDRLPEAITLALSDLGVPSVSCGGATRVERPSTTCVVRG